MSGIQCRCRQSTVRQFLQSVCSRHRLPLLSVGKSTNISFQGKVLTPVDRDDLSTGSSGGSDGVGDVHAGEGGVGEGQNSEQSGEGLHRGVELSGCRTE